MRTFFIFIFIWSNFTFGQNVAVNTISQKLAKLNNDFPKIINNQTDASAPLGFGAWILVLGASGEASVSLVLGA